MVWGEDGLLVTERRSGDPRQGDRRHGPTNRRVSDAEDVRRRPTALLVVRAWTEPESAQPLRAHVRVTGDISIGIERSFTAVDAATVTELVEEWLRGIVDG